MSTRFILALYGLALTSPWGFAQEILRPQNIEPQTVVVFEKGDLKVTIVNNMSYGPDHRAGYNGITDLLHPAQDSMPFVPSFAGFNLEHIFGGDSLKQLFEPRSHPMVLSQSSEDEVSLYQAPTPLSGLESLTTFKLVEPHYIDITFRCIVYEIGFFKHGYAGLFWASYIDSPSNKNIYFYGCEKREPTKKWIEAFSQKHGVESTHMGMSDDNKFYFAPNFNARLASHFSNYRYALPFFFGRFHNMVLAYMFESPEVIRFSQSPTGGGKTNPAWDFQLIIPDLKKGKEYTFRARIIYKPFISAEDITSEYFSWKKGLHCLSRN